MQLGVPFTTYIAVFETGIACAVVASQCERRQGGLEARAIHSLSPLMNFWSAIYILGLLTWPLLLVLPFLQFHFLTALKWLAVGAFPSSILIGVYFALRRGIDEMILVHRSTSIIGFICAITLWFQAIVG